jgi:hypothetical protein
MDQQSVFLYAKRYQPLLVGYTRITLIEATPLAKKIVVLALGANGDCSLL